MRTLFLFILCCNLSLSVLAQGSGKRPAPVSRSGEPNFSYMSLDSLVQSGPMNGYAFHREVGVWLQLRQPATAYIAYWPITNPKQIRFSQTLTAQESNSYILKFAVGLLEPGTKYGYKVVVDNRDYIKAFPFTFQTQELWQWRKDAPDFTVAFGSCAYINEPQYDRPGKPYGQGDSIFYAIAAEKPQVMVWGGDNTYLREVDWYSKLGIYHRFGHTRRTKSMAELLATATNLAIWDDHDYGPNDSDRGWVMKKTTEQAFNDFWMNPSTNALGTGGITTTYEYNDVQFFLLDDRYHRAPNKDSTKGKDYLSKAQINWLIDNLLNSYATFKVIINGGQVLNPARAKENYSTYPEEHAYLLQRLAEVKVSGVLFLSGDRHFTELTKLNRPGTYPLYDLTCSPLSSGSAKPDDKENNYNRVEGTLVREPNYATLAVAGPKKERSLTLTVKNKQGKALWSQTLKASELK